MVSARVIAVQLAGRWRWRQYESDERTSPPWMVFRPIQMTGLMVFLMKWTEPSPKPAIARRRDAGCAEPE